MKIKFYKQYKTLAGVFLADLPTTTVFVTDDQGVVHQDPEILEQDGDCVVIKYDWNPAGEPEERMGTAIAVAMMTPEEALRIAKRKRYTVDINGRRFEWWPGNRREMPQWCAGYVKRRGSRTHLIPVNDEQALGLINGTHKISYWTNSNRCEITAA
jgi:hypothetical protein